MSSRRAHQCHRDGCDSEALWAVKLAFLCKGMGLFRRRITAPSSIIVCGEHRNDAMSYILSPLNRDRIEHWLENHNFPPPDFASAEFEFIRVDHMAIDAEHGLGVETAQ